MLIFFCPMYALQGSAGLGEKKKWQSNGTEPITEVVPTSNRKMNVLGGPVLSYQLYA